MNSRIARERTEENAPVRFLLEDFLLGPKLLVYDSVARHVEALRSILREWLGEGSILSKEIKGHLIIASACTFEFLSGIDLRVKCIFIKMIQPNYGPNMTIDS